MDDEYREQKTDRFVVRYPKTDYDVLMTYLTPLMEQAYDTLSWIVDQYIPIGMRAAMQGEKTYGHSLFKYLPLVGVTPAPSYTTEMYPMRHEKMLKFPRRFKARREYQSTPLLHKLFGNIE